MASKTLGRKTFACTEGPNNHVGHGKCQAVWCRCECHAAKPEQVVTFSYQQAEGRSAGCVGEVVGYSADRISGLVVA